MIIIKFIMLLLVFIVCSFLGNIIAKRYSLRVKELNEFNVALSIVESKINFTYEPLPEIFLDVSNMVDKSISQIFNNASQNMKEHNAKEAWENSFENINSNLSSEDIENIKSLGKMLGQTDKQGQINQLEMTQTLVEMQIKKAKDEESKNAKMYKTLGTIVGLAIFIILI